MLCSAPLAPARPDTNAAAVASTVKSSTANVFCPRDTRRARMVSGASIGPNARTGAVQYDAVFAAICRRCVDRGRQRHAANEGGDFTTPHCVGDAKAGTASHRDARFRGRVGPRWHANEYGGCVLCYALHAIVLAPHHFFH